MTQFNNIWSFRPNVALHIPRPSTRACRAKNLFNWAINWRCHNNNTGLSSLAPEMNWVVSFLHLPMYQTCSQVLELNCNSSPHLMTLIIDHWTARKVWRLIFTVQNSLIQQVSKNSSPYKYHPLLVFLHLSWWRPLVWGWN